MKVCIAEKPSVAREIAAIVGARSRQEGYIEGNGYAVTWTFGHFCMLKSPDDYQPHWKRWDLNSLPMLPEKFETKLISIKGVKKQFGIIKKLLKKAKSVINCGDAGQEGELIQRWVLRQAGYKGPVQRLWISSLTPEAIRDGFRNLQDASAFDRLYFAGSSRAIGDWLLGMNATRLYTLKYGSGKQVLSIGRVQTPTLAMLVARHKEIENFVPEPYWELQTIYREVTFNCEKGRFLKKEDGLKWLQHVTGKPFVILSFTKKKGKEYPPRLFDLTSLQVHCNKRFGYSAEQTLKLVQQLYEKKMVTYPRVDTTYLPSDVYPKVSGILKKLTNYSQFTQPLLGKTIRKSAKVFNDKKVTDHHAIIPTGVQKSLPANEQNVYDAITRRFIAAFYPDCIVSNNTVIGEVDGLRFKATGKEILDPGWRVLFPKVKSKKNPPKAGQKEEEKILPEFVQGESGPHQPKLVDKMTQPPKPYTEATLLRAMETAGKKVDDEELRDLMKANGIGRPSTRANIIETLFKRRYIRRVKKQIHPTETGIQLIDTIQNDLLKSAELTGQWEKQLREIESGAHTAQQFVADMKQMVSKLVEEVRLSKDVRRIATAAKGFAAKKRSAKKRSPAIPPAKILTEQRCPKCRKGQLLKGKSAYGCSRWKEGCSFRLPFEYAGKKIPERQLLRLFKYGATIQLKGFKQDGLPQAGVLRFDDDFQLVLQSKVAPSRKKSKPAGEKLRPSTSRQTKKAPVRKQVPDELKCPKCGLGKIVKGKTAYGCSFWQTGCTFRYSFEDIRKQAAGRPLTKELVWQLLNQKT
ncbi:MAG: DNA topoisomerase 3 [Bacteroidota bacterium]